MKNLLTLLILLNINFIIGQNIDLTSELNRMELAKKANKKIDAKGSQYTNDTYLPVKISSIPNLVFMGKYNAYSDDIEVLIDGKKAPIALRKSKSKYTILFSTLNKTYGIYKLDDENRFLVEIVKDNNVSLLKKEQIKYHRAEEAKSSYQKAKRAEFRRLKDLYYLSFNSKTIEVPTNKKKFSKLFPKIEKETLTYIKKNSIKLNKESDLKKLVIFINNNLEK